MALNRNGIADMIRDCLLADTTTLYGTGKLAQTITSDPTLYEKAGVDTVTGFAIFLNCVESTPQDYRMQNHDRSYEVSFRIRGLHVDPESARDTIDQIDAQMELLVNEQIYGGYNFTSYYSDSKGQVYDVQYDSSRLVVETRGDEVIAECEGAITVFTNRVR